MSMTNENCDVSIQSSSSTLSQRVKALEEAGMHDHLVKKRIPSYAAAAAAVGSELQKLSANSNLYVGNSGLTKIYQNPSNFGELDTSFTSTKLVKESPSSVIIFDTPSKFYRSNIPSNEREKLDTNKPSKLNRIYKSNSSECLGSNNKTEPTQNCIMNSRHSSSSNSTITNDHTPVSVMENELANRIKTLKKVSCTASASSRSSSSVSNRVAGADDSLNLNIKPLNDNLVVISSSSPISPIYSPNQNTTSFSKKTAQLIAESLQRHSNSINNNNLNYVPDENVHIPISIPLLLNGNNTKNEDHPRSSLYEPQDIEEIENDAFNGNLDDEDSKRSSISTSSPITNNNYSTAKQRSIIAIDGKRSHQTDDINSARFDSKSSSVSSTVKQTNNALSSNLSSSSNDLLVTTTPFKAPSYEQLNSSHDVLFRNNSNNNNRNLLNNHQQMKSSTVSTPIHNKRNSSLYDDYINSNNNHNQNISNPVISLNNNNQTSFKSNTDSSYNNNSNNSRSQLLIFNSEYTRGMSQNFHTDHFSCWHCDKSLTGSRYILKDDHPYCIGCYEEQFAHDCEECKKKIGTDSKDLSYKDKHWHEKCFFCHVCKLPLVDKPFGSKNDSLYCGECYNQAFASRCDKCAQIFKPGMKKMEYKGQQFHENCFLCSSCTTPIGSKSFIPKDSKIYCVPCYEQNFATKCTLCTKVISQGGVTYKNQPFHRECFTCTNCNQSLAGQRFTSRDEHPYCSECFGKLFAKKCYACAKPITGIGGTKYISFEERHWHNDCFVCNQCHTSLVGRGFLTDAMDILCPDCGRN